LVAKEKKPDALGVRLQWPETEPSTPIDAPRLHHRAPEEGDLRPRRPRSRRRALPAGEATSTAIEAPSKASSNGMADSLDRFTERVAALTEAVDGLRTQLEENSRDVADLVADVSARLTTLQQATEEVGRVRAAVGAERTEGLERQVTELIKEVKATRRSVSVSSGKKKALDDAAVERIVRSVVERLTEKPAAPKKSRSRQSSVAG
jgi:uncharacterized protein YoxC